MSSALPKPRLWWRLLRLFLMVVMVAVTLTSAIGWWRWRAALPAVEGRVPAAGLSVATRITRDPYGVPHVQAADELAAAFATGFVHGQDRLFQMDLMRRASAGRLAELFGPMAVPSDRRARRLGHGVAAASDLAGMPGDDREILESYARGVNAAVSSATALPAEYAILRSTFAPWTALDSVLSVRAMQERLVLSSRELTRFRVAEQVGIKAAAWLMDGELAGDAVILAAPSSGPKGEEGMEAAGAANESRQTITSAMLQREALNLGLSVERPASSPAPIAATREARREQNSGWSDAVQGSNSWVVAGSHSRSGAPLLANDTHLALDTPAPFYMLALAWPGIKVAGASVPGFPGVVIGRNRHLAWSVTILTADTVDYVVETLHSEDRDRYLANGDGASRWLSFQQREEIIQVRGAEAVTETVRVSRHGPVVDAAWRPGRVLVRARRPPRTMGALTAVRGFAGASSSEAFRQAAGAHDLPAENLVYAATDGSIGYVAAGALALRAGHSGLLPVAGHLYEQVYDGWDDPDDRPFADNPPQGFLATANNRVMRSRRGDAWNRAWIRGDRAARAEELLASTRLHDPGSFRAMQGDTYARKAALLLDPLMALRQGGVWDLPAGHGPVHQAWALLESWNRHFDAGPAPGLFALFHDHLRRRVFADDVGDALSGAVDNGLLKLLAPGRFAAADGAAADTDWWDDTGTAAVRETMTMQVAAALLSAWEEMERRAPGGPLAWNWPDLHRARFIHPLGRQPALAPLFNGPSVAVGGAGGVLLANAFSTARSFDVLAIPAMRMVADMSPDGGLRMVVPIGQSGVPASAHFDDLAELWRTFADVELFRDAGPQGTTLILEVQP